MNNYVKKHKERTGWWGINDAFLGLDTQRPIEQQQPTELVDGPICLLHGTKVGKGHPAKDVCVVAMVV